MNCYLKEIATLYGIKKTGQAQVRIGHLAGQQRVTAKRDKMLGRLSTKMIQRNAKILDQTILKDMQKVEKQLSKL